MTGCCTFQEATAIVNQNQTVKQLNYSEQDLAFALAIGEGSSATAVQWSNQNNSNMQAGAASAGNGAQASCCPPPLTEYKIDGCSNVSQLNNNSQGYSVAISFDGGVATAEQMCNQNNFANRAGSVDKAQEDNKQENYVLKAEAKRSELNEKAVIAITGEGLDLQIQIAQNGDLYLNGNKIKTASNK